MYVAPGHRRIAGVRMYDVRDTLYTLEAIQFGKYRPLEKENDQLKNKLKKKQLDQLKKLKKTVNIVPTQYTVIRKPFGKTYAQCKRIDTVQRCDAGRPAVHVRRMVGTYCNHGYCALKKRFLTLPNILLLPSISEPALPLIFFEIPRAWEKCAKMKPEIPR